MPIDLSEFDRDSNRTVDVSYPTKHDAQLVFVASPRGLIPPYHEENPYTPNHIRKQLFGKPQKQTKRKSKENQEIDTTVYLIVDKHNSVCKIGFSKNVEKRLASIQTAYPYPLEIRQTLKGDVELEREIHKTFERYRLNGEWFSYNEVIDDYFMLYELMKKKKG